MVRPVDGMRVAEKDDRIQFRVNFGLEEEGIDYKQILFDALKKIILVVVRVDLDILKARHEGLKEQIDSAFLRNPVLRPLQEAINSLPSAGRVLE
jgi:hypothetical protein